MKNTRNPWKLFIYIQYLFHHDYRMNTYGEIPRTVVSVSVLALLLFFAHTTGARAIERLKITIPAGISLTEGEIRTRLPAAISWEHRDYDEIEIVIYYFTAGTEKLSYNDADDFGLTSNDGNIKSLIKLKKKTSLIQVLFVDAGGSGRENILVNFSHAITSSLKIK